MKKKLILILTLLVLVGVSLSLASAVNDTSDSEKLTTDDNSKLSDDLPAVSDDDIYYEGDINIEIDWQDNNDAQNKRPDSVDVEIMLRGETMPAKISKEDSWKMTLPNEQVYTKEDFSLEAQKIPGYTLEITGDVKTGIKIKYSLDVSDDTNDTDKNSNSQNDDTSDDSSDTPQKTTTTKTVTKTVTKKTPANKTAKKTVKDKHNTGNPILLGVLAFSAAGAVMHIRKRK